MNQKLRFFFRHLLRFVTFHFSMRFSIIPFKILLPYDGISKFITNNCLPRDSIPFVLTTPPWYLVIQSIHHPHYLPDEKSSQKNPSPPFWETKRKKGKKKRFSISRFAGFSWWIEREREREDRSKSVHGFLFLFRGQTRGRAKVNSSAAMYTANYRGFDSRISNHGRSWLNWND